ncbi:MAG TPA: BtrH N-terminal domain-containing protein [Burkholderiales bacterium]|nr:BtrH N-terminal domain-containing protein [Burkholderiales bacterium]
MPPFVHQHASHCESGVMSSLVRHRGLPMSEAMAFGLSSAILFAYLPFIRVHGLPIIAYRSPPRGIIRRLDRDLGLGMRFERFRSPAEGTRRLNELLEQGSLVGLQTSAFWLPYFPPDMRFHFNAHNLIVYGRDGDEYLVSDPVGETVVRIARADLEKARFAKGILAPKGLLYHATANPAAPNWAKLGKRALARAASPMLRTPLPFIGVRGIRLLAWQVSRLADDAHARLYVGNIVRMQEEIGTGGAGFRFLYASFLQELAGLTGYKPLEGLSARLVEVGDRWREFALAAARMIRARDPFDARVLGARLRELAADEKKFFGELDAAQRAWAC